MATRAGAGVVGLVVALIGCGRPTPTRPANEPCADPAALVAPIETARAEGSLHVAERLARAAFATCPHPTTRLALAATLADLGLDDEALEQYRSYQRTPGAAERADIAAAIAAIEARPAGTREVSAADRERARTFYTDGVNARLSGRHADALRSLRQAYALYPHPLTIVEIARAHSAAGNAVEAKRALARAVAIAEKTRGAPVSPRMPTWQASVTNAVAYAPDGRRVVSSGAGRVRLWDAGSGLELTSFAAELFSMQMMPDGKHVVGIVDGGFAVYDIARGIEVFRAANLAQQPMRIAVAPDGSEIATSEDDPNGVVNRWAWPGGALIDRRETDPVEPARPTAEDGQTTALAYTADGRRLIVAGYGVARTVDRTSGAVLEVETGPAGMVMDIAVGPGDEIALADQTGRLTRRRLTLAAGRVQDLGSGLVAVAMSSDGTRLASGDENGEVQLWQTSSGAGEPPLLRFQAHRGAITDLTFSPDGGWLVTAGVDGSLQRWDLGGEHAPLQLVQARQPILTLCSDGDAFATAAGKRVFVWKAGAAEPVTMAASDIVEACAFGRGSLVIAARGGELRSFALDDGMSRAIATEPATRALALNPDGRFAMTSAGARDASVPRSAALYRMADGQLLRRIHLANAVALAPGGATLATADNEKTTSWDVASGSPRSSLAAPGTLLAFSPDGAALAVAGSNDDGPMIAVGPTRGGKPTATQPLPKDATALAWADERTLVVATSSTLELRERGDLRQRLVLDGHTGSITNVVRVGAVLVSASDDGTLRVWGLDGAPRGTLYLTADGDWIVVAATGHIDGNALGKDLLSWQVGDVTLPDYAAWDRQHQPGLLPTLLR